VKTVEGWKISSLISLLHTMKSGGTPDTSRAEYYGGAIPFVSIEDMTACRKHLSFTAKTITNEGLRKSNSWMVPPYAILYSIYATLGLSRINNAPVATNQAILALINDPRKIDRDYLYYWLEYIRHRIFNFSSQTTQSNLSASIVKSFSVVHPIDLSEQALIAEVLSTVDWAIEQTEALIAKQQSIKTGLMQDLLTRGIDEHGNLRSEKTHKFKDSPLGRIPVEWEVRKIHETGSITLGRQLAKSI
jgi:type I restriction enzyme S subunit